MIDNVNTWTFYAKSRGTNQRCYGAEAGVVVVTPVVGVNRSCKSSVHMEQVVVSQSTSTCGSVPQVPHWPLAPLSVISQQSFKQLVSSRCSPGHT